MFIDSYLKHCEDAGVSPTRVLKDLGISHSLLKRWKDGSEPTNPTKKKLADYFNITIDELMSGEKEKPANNEDDELNEYLDELRNRSEMRMLFKLAKGATKEDVEQAVKIIEALKK